MQYDIVVGVVAIVVMLVPVGCIDVDFYIANPYYSVNFDFSVEKIGTRIVVMLTYVDYLERCIVGELFGAFNPKVVLVYEM